MGHLAKRPEKPRLRSLGQNQDQQQPSGEPATWPWRVIAGWTELITNQSTLAANQMRRPAPASATSNGRACLHHQGAGLAQFARSKGGVATRDSKAVLVCSFPTSDGGREPFPL